MARDIYQAVRDACLWLPEAEEFVSRVLDLGHEGFTRSRRPRGQIGLAPSVDASFKRAPRTGGGLSRTVTPAGRRRWRSQHSSGDSAL